jgi:hypothetical protein
MTDEDKCGKAAELFYQHLNDRLKKDPDDIVENPTAYAYEWAMRCGFDHPRCFVEYIENVELDRWLEEYNKKKSA